MKDFDAWNIKKKLLDKKEVKLYYHTREIWWCYIGMNIRTEQNGDQEKFLRPVVIIRGFGQDSCLVVPLTTSQREHKMRVDVGVVDGKRAKANLSQMRVIDTNRLLEKICFMEKDKYKNRVKGTFRGLKLV